MAKKAKRTKGSPSRGSEKYTVVAGHAPIPRSERGMSQIALAIIALLMFAVGIVTWQFEGGETAGPVLVRVGIVLAAFWLAMPQLQVLFKRGGGQYAVLMAIAGVVMILSPKGIKVIIPVGVLATLALGGLQIASRFFGSNISKRG